MSARARVCHVGLKTGQLTLEAAEDASFFAVGDRLYTQDDVTFTCEPLTEAEQDVVEYARRRTAPSWTSEEMSLLFALVDRLPRVPRKKPLGQLMREKLSHYASNTDDAYEHAVAAVIAEYELRRRSSP